MSCIVILFVPPGFIIIPILFPYKDRLFPIEHSPFELKTAPLAQYAAELRSKLLLMPHAPNFRVYPS